MLLSFMVSQVTHYCARRWHWQGPKPLLTSLLRCLWKRREVVLELQWFCEQQDLWFSWPPHKCHPPMWCMAMVAAAKYIGLWGQISSFLKFPMIIALIFTIIQFTLRWGVLLQLLQQTERQCSSWKSIWGWWSGGSLLYPGTQKNVSHKWMATGTAKTLR